MAEIGSRWRGYRSVTAIVLVVVVTASGFVVTDGSVNVTKEAESDNLSAVLHFLKQPVQPSQHVWPEMRFGWRILVSTVIGFFGAAFGSVGGIGGGGIFVPMLTLIIDFDAKSSTALSKCMVMGAAIATVYYNLKLRHPTLDLPIIDYDLALLMQPMLVLGISLGVALNVIFANWMITVSLIILFLVISTKAFLTGIERWKKETIAQKEAAKPLESNGDVENEVALPVDSSRNAQLKTQRQEVSVIENVRWKELCLLFVVWFLMLAIQIVKNYTTNCSIAYWLLNLAQIPVAVAVTSYEAINLYKGRRIIASNRGIIIWKVRHLILCCVCGVLAGTFGGLLGLGGGFILGPLFLELGIPPQVSSATSTFLLTFSSSLSVVEYYLLKRFPVPYALYFFAVATIAAIAGQYVVTKAINMLGRASIIIFVLAFTILASAILLGGVGIWKMIKGIQLHEDMGFENICR